MSTQRLCCRSFLHKCVSEDPVTQQVTRPASLKYPETELLTPNPFIQPPSRTASARPLRQNPAKLSPANTTLPQKQRSESPPSGRRSHDGGPTKHLETKQSRPSARQLTPTHRLCPLPRVPCDATHDRVMRARNPPFTTEKKVYWRRLAG